MAASGSDPRVLLERYELREQVGLGGMGEVWLGWDRRLQRDVAVKLLLAQLSDESSFRQRFEVEARIAAALDHPNVVNVYDIDDDGGSLFIVMERLPGPSLDRRLAEGPMGTDEVVRVATDMLSGLAAAHEQDLIHRDIKPGNLIRSAGGRWKVGDFGVAKDLASSAHLTLVGVAVGTPAYLAPEQLDGRPATPATDLWAAAVVLREALTGRRPFEGNDPIEVAHAVQHVAVPPLARVRPDISPGLAGAIDRGLSLDPAHRFSRAIDMLAAIEGRDRLAGGSPVGTGPVGADPRATAPAPANPLPGGPAPAAGPVPPAAAVVLPAAMTAGARAPGPGPIEDPPIAVPVAPGGHAHRTLGPSPPVAPPPTDARSSFIPLLWAVTAVGGVILLFLLVGLVFGAVMVGDDDSDDDPPATTAMTQPLPSSAPPATAPDRPPPPSTAPEGPGGPAAGDGSDPSDRDERPRPSDPDDGTEAPGGPDESVPDGDPAPVPTTPTQDEEQAPTGLPASATSNP